MSANPGLAIERITGPARPAELLPVQEAGPRATRTWNCATRFGESFLKSSTYGRQRMTRELRQPQGATWAKRRSAVLMHGDSLLCARKQKVCVRLRFQPVRRIYPDASAKRGADANCLLS